MSTRILKKVAVLFVSALMIVAAFAGLTFSSSALTGTTMGGTTTDNATAKKIAVWGFNGRTYATAVNYKTTNGSSAVIGATTVGSSTIITIDLSNLQNTDNTGNLWVKDGTENLTVALSTDDDASDNTTLASFGYTFNATVGDSFIMPNTNDSVKVEIVGVDKDMAVKDAFASKKLAAFLGYSMSVVGVDNGVTYKASDDAATITVVNDEIRISYKIAKDGTDPSGIAYLTGSGGAILGNQQFPFTANLDSKTKTSTVSGIFTDNNGVKVATVAWTFTKEEAPAPATWTGNKDGKWTAIAADLANDKLVLTVGDKAKSMADSGYTYGYIAPTADKPVGTLVINTFADAIPDKLVMSFAKGAILGADYKYTITLYHETALVPLADGSVVAINIKVNTNKDIVSPLTSNTVFHLRYSRLNFDNSVSLDTLTKTIFLDMINGRAGQTSKYWADITDKADANYDKLKTPVEKEYANLVKVVNFVGYTADAALKPRNPMGQASFYTNEMFAAGTDAEKIDAAARRLWGGNGFNFFFDMGGETVNYYVNIISQSQRLDVVYDGNTYAYGLYFVAPTTDMTIKALATGVNQKVDAQYTNLGDYQYTISEDSKATSPAALATTYAIKGLSLPVKETNPVIKLTSYYDPTVATGDQNDYNKTGTVLAMRVPAGTTIAVSNASGCIATVLDIKSATYGNVASDGMVDAFVNIDYGTFGASSFKMTLTYANGIAKTFVVNTEFVLKTAKADDAATKAFAAFSNNYGTSLTLGNFAYGEEADRVSPVQYPSNPNSTTELSSDDYEQYASKDSGATSSTVVSTGSDVSTAPDTGNAFNGLAYILTIGATAIGGISTLVIRKKK